MKQEQVKRIGDYLDQCSVTIQSHVKSHWRDVEVRCLGKDWDTETARLYVEGGTKPVVYTYPIIEKLTQEYQAFVVLREFGDYLITKAPAEMDVEWRQKLILPTTEQIDAFQQRLNQGFTSYQEVVDSLKSPLDRLVALHMANAMMYNGQAFAGASNVNVREWGPTKEFATMTRYFSIAPLTSAYCPRDIHKDFGCAFASCVVFDLKTVLHSDVKQALRGLIDRIVAAAR
ncbi:MAG: hypothetical protein ACOYB3_00185 [Azonexus sp.]